MPYRRSIPAVVARPVATLAAALTLLAAASSCSKRVTSVDPDFTVPEGTPSADSRLMVWPDAANDVALYFDNVPPGPDPGDDFLGTRSYRRSVAGAIQGQIVDRTPAGEYQVFRTEDNGGVRRFTDFGAARTERWLDTAWEAYRFVDPSPAPTMRYLARGVVQGVAGESSPLSNTGMVAIEVEPINLSAVWFPPRRKLKLKWDLVPGVDRYLVQVYSFRGDIRGVDEIILSGTFAPLYDGASHDLFVGFVPGTVDFMFVGDSTRSDIETLTLRPTFYGQEYLVRMTGLDANGTIVAHAPGTLTVVTGLDGDGTYGVFSLGAVATVDTVEVPTGAGLRGGVLPPAFRSRSVTSSELPSRRSRLGRLLR